MTDTKQPSADAGERHPENIFDMAPQSRPLSAGSRVLGTTRSGRKSVTKFMSSGRGEWRDKGTSFKWVKPGDTINENEEQRVCAIVTYQRIHVFASQNSPPNVGLVVLPACTAHIDRVHIDYFFSFFARWCHSTFGSIVVGRDVHEGTAIEPLTGVKPRGSSVACTEGT